MVKKTLQLYCKPDGELKRMEYFVCMFVLMAVKMLLMTGVLFAFNTMYNVALAVTVVIDLIFTFFHYNIDCQRLHSFKATNLLAKVLAGITVLMIINMNYFELISMFCLVSMCLINVYLLFKPASK